MFARAWLFEFPRYRTESHGCATRSAQAVLAERSDSVPRFGGTQGGFENKSKEGL